MADLVENQNLVVDGWDASGPWYEDTMFFFGLGLLVAAGIILSGLVATGIIVIQKFRVKGQHGKLIEKAIFYIGTVGLDAIVLAFAQRDLFGLLLGCFIVFFLILAFMIPWMVKQSRTPEYFHKRFALCEDETDTVCKGYYTSEIVALDVYDDLSQDLLSIFFVFIAQGGLLYFFLDGLSTLPDPISPTTFFYATIIQMVMGSQMGAGGGPQIRGVLNAQDWAVQKEGKVLTEYQFEGVKPAVVWGRVLLSVVSNAVFQCMLFVATPLFLGTCNGMDFCMNAFAVLFITAIDDLPNERTMILRANLPPGFPPSLEEPEEPEKPEKEEKEKPEKPAKAEDIKVEEKPKPDEGQVAGA